MSICRSYDAPAKEEERLIYCLLLSTHPDRYTWCTRIHDLVACLRAELQQAQRRPRPAPRITTPIIFPPNQPWPPWQSPAIAQPNCPQASGTGAAPPSSSCHHAPKHKAPPPDCTTPRCTAKPKAPPPDCTTVPKHNATPILQIPSALHHQSKSPPPVCATPHRCNAASSTHSSTPHVPPLPPPSPYEPPPATHVAHPTPPAHPPTGDWWQDQAYVQTLEELRFAEEIRLATAASLVEAETEHTIAQESGRYTPAPPGPPNTPAPTTSHEPAPPPIEPYDDDEHDTNANGITTHRYGWQYKVTVKCKSCKVQYKTRWGLDHEPYDEITAAGWTKGRDSSGNWTWQKAHCPNFRHGCSRTRPM